MSGLATQSLRTTLMSEGKHTLSMADRGGVPECLGIQPCDMLHVSRELALQEVEPLRGRIVDICEGRQ